MDWQRIINYIDDNKEWIFSGIGVLSISLILNFLFKRGKNAPSTTININSEISLVEVKEIAESVFYKNFPILLESAKQEANNNKDLFILELIKTLESRLDNIEYIAFRNPDIQYILLQATIISSRKNSSKKRELLSNLIVNRVKSNDYEFGEIIYNDAINAIALLTTTQIKILSLIEITTSLIFLIINKEFVFPRLDLLLSFLDEPFEITTNDIEHLKYINLLSSTFPYEIDRTPLNEYNEDEFRALKEKCEELFEKIDPFNTGQVQLSLTGKAIAQINISLAIDNEINNLKRGPQKLSDFKANNITATGDITAYAK